MLRSRCVGGISYGIGSRRTPREAQNARSARILHFPRRPSLAWGDFCFDFLMLIKFLKFVEIFWKCSEKIYFKKFHTILKKVLTKFFKKFKRNEKIYLFLKISLWPKSKNKVAVFCNKKIFLGKTFRKFFWNFYCAARKTFYSFMWKKNLHCAPQAKFFLKNSIFLSEFSSESLCRGFRVSAENESLCRGFGVRGTISGYGFRVPFQGTISGYHFRVPFQKSGQIQIKPVKSRYIAYMCICVVCIMCECTAVV